jgi:pSer/pThr/pTyr-binding forkhead associated (FHA) protein
MAELTIQVLEGVDRGRVFQRLSTPIYIGREEGNTVQLNDERVSRCHAKIQDDQGQLVLTDLESTNGTRVNGEPVPLTILRVGDRIALGRSVLLVGSPEQLDLLIGLSPSAPAASGQTMDLGLDPNKTRHALGVTDSFDAEQHRSDELKFQLNFHAGEASPPPESRSEEPESSTPRAAPGLPARLSPAQAAQLAELLLHLHQLLASAVDEVTEHLEDGGVRLNQSLWQRILRVEMELARLHYRVGHPE